MYVKKIYDKKYRNLIIIVLLIATNYRHEWLNLEVELKQTANTKNITKQIFGIEI